MRLWVRNGSEIKTSSQNSLFSIPKKRTKKPTQKPQPNPYKPQTNNKPTK